MRRILLLTIFASLFVATLAAQPIRKSTYENMIKAAEQSLASNDYYNALDWYEQAYEEREDKELLITIADMHYQLRDYKKAERSYGRLLNKDKENKYSAYRFNYGKVLKMNEKYPEAIQALQQFATETKSDSLKKLARVEITGAEMAMEMPEIAKGVNLENVGKKVNNKLSEYAPTYGPDGSLYFVGFDGDNVFYVDEESDEDYFARIQKSSMGKKGWDKPSDLDKKINRPGVHKTYVSFSNDGRYMFYTQGELSGHSLGVSRVYYSTGDGGSWSAGQQVKGIGGDYVVKHPVAGELFGNEVLFFSSNMAGGYGGYDLYYATKKGDGEYDAPVNLGEKINTLGDDETPFYWDGTLYFSTNGHPTIGGFDIYYTTWDGSSWSAPENMGKVYNSSADDLYFSLGDDGYKGFLASNRPGEGSRSAKSRTCCNDIYGFSIARIYADLVVGVFSEDKKPIKGSTVKLIELQEPSEDSKKNDDGNRFDFGLGLELPYKVVVSAEGFYPDSIEFNTVGLSESQTFNKNFLLKPLPPPPPRYDTLNINEPIVLENILYDFNDDRITKASEQDLQIVLDLMNEYPEMVIELASHTDSRGQDAYNENLSQRRANSARRWLINRGVKGERIKAKGYGKKKPQKVRQTTSQKYDYLNEGDELTDEFIYALEGEDKQEVAHQLNRRTDFTIIEGPTTITIQRIKKVEENTKDAPKGKNALPQVPKNDTLQISYLSSLYHMRDNLKGVPIMHFENRLVDFGKIKRGEKREYDFEFVNKGDTDLKIAIVSGCECTETEYSSTKVYKPGDKGVIKVYFDSTEKEESETVDVDILLDNVEPDTGIPIREAVQFKFELIK
ncbi:MAG: OmpA family protein [Bacteroidota bacterium]